MRPQSSLDAGHGPKGLFVAGTDTGVGKTFVCGLLVRHFREIGMPVGYQKWVSTGGGEVPADLLACSAAANMAVSAEEIPLQVPYSFELAASPHLAAEQEGQSVDPAVLEESYKLMVSRHRPLVVEGVGGLLVPLRRDLLLIDLLALLGLPTLLVARSGLGTLNHTLLSLEALRRRDIPVLGVLFSDAEEREDELLVSDNLRTIAEIGQTPVFGRLRRYANSSAAAEAFRPMAEAIAAALLPHDRA